MSIERLPVSPETVTVLGDRVNPDDPRWTGLDFTSAEPRTQASIMVALCGADAAPPDLHLNVPWQHPEDRARGIDYGSIYRVRPRMAPGKRWKGRMVQSVAFERWHGQWFLAVDFAGKKRQREVEGERT